MNTTNTEKSSNALTQNEQVELQIKTNEALLQMAKHAPTDTTIFLFRWVFFPFVALMFFIFIAPAYADGATADIFATLKPDIKATVGTGSIAQFALVSAGLCAAAFTGYTTKNWGAAIGAFVVGMIFVNGAMTVIGL